MKKIKYLLLLLTLVSCKSYYVKQQQFNYYFEKGEYVTAEKRYQSIEKPEGQNKLLYNMNMGMLNHLQGKYELSNQFFEKAYLHSQDYHKNFTTDLGSIFVSSAVNKYYGNPMEILLINYYKALNYSLLNQNEKAMVECRRALSALQYIDDKYISNNKYQRDPYIYNMVGLIFEIGGEDNNALVCLKRAVDIYQKDNTKNFGIGVPEQLKYDIIRLAKKSGDNTALENYSKMFGESYNVAITPKNTKEVLVLWHNGLCPVKTESNLMFNMTNNGGGNLMFVNDDIGLNIPVFFSINSNNANALSSISFLRMALPRYKERKLVYTHGDVQVDKETKSLNLGQDFSLVDQKILKDQLAATLAQSITRVLIRQVAAYEASKKNDLLGVGLSLAGALVEKSDTRNWQSLPHSAYYTRVYVPETSKDIQINLKGDDGQIAKTVKISTDSLSTKKINIVNVITPEFSRY
jgi:uncharacterized protein